MGLSATHNVGLANHLAHNGFDSVVHTTGHAATLVFKAPSLNSFIKPSQNTRLPVIAPVLLASAVQPINSKTTVSTTLTHSIQNDLYAWGNCTWWVAMRRSQINDPIPNSWGNATTWAARASSDGYTVNHSPSPGSIMQISGVDGGLGHVAFVESVDPDGTWHISEMNVLGLDVIDHKAEPSSMAVNYRFIHDKI